MNDWEFHVSIELYEDGHLREHYRERRGAFVQHVPLDRGALRQALAEMARRAAGHIIKGAEIPLRRP